MEKIKLVGKWNDLELGYLENNTYFKTGLLEDSSHSWKILEWIDQNLEAGFPIQVLKVQEDMMEESQRKNKAALDKIVKGAFRNLPQEAKMFVRKLVEIDERWGKRDGVVYRLWRFVPDTEWQVQPTPYKEIPVVVLKNPESEA